MPNFDVDEYAKKLANDFLHPVSRDDKTITSAQLRRFYNDFKSLERRFILMHKDSKEEKAKAFQSLLPQIKLTKAKVAYARARQTVPSNFEKWLTDAVSAINSPETFEEFLLHFEAIVGFAYGLGLKDNS